MTPTERERIEKEADELLRKYWPADNFLNEGRKKWYIAGATAEHDKIRNQTIDDVLSEIRELAKVYPRHAVLVAVRSRIESLKTNQLT